MEYETQSGGRRGYGAEKGNKAADAHHILNCRTLPQRMSDASNVININYERVDIWTHVGAHTVEYRNDDDECAGMSRLSELSTSQLPAE